MTDPEITKLESGKTGPTVAVFAGVHGNETAGIQAVQELKTTLKITRGKAILVLANPQAIKQGVRMLGKNLNRCFYAENRGNTPEDIIARQLMKLLDECDALLDLHMFYGDDGLPFVICEQPAVDLADKLDVGIVSTNWAQIEPGATDGFMFEAGKIGICVECGPIGKAGLYASFAKKTVLQFLKYFDMLEQPVQFSAQPKRRIKAVRAITKSSDDFVLMPGFKSFQKLHSGQVIAASKDHNHVAGKDQCIIFPHYAARIGEEAYILGREDG